MRKYIRRKVINFEERPNDSPDKMSRRLFSVCITAVLASGHRLNQGVAADYRPKWKACSECELKRDQESTKAERAVGKEDEDVMTDRELEDFKQQQIDLREYAAKEGYVLDKRESWGGSAVMRNGGDKVIIKRDGDGHYVYFSVRDERATTAQ